MNNTPKQIAENLLRELSDRGQIIEGGWKGYEILVLDGCSDIQKNECRKAFFFGAQHLFASVLGMLSPEEDATDLDVERMEKLDSELRKFLTENGGFK